MSEQGSHTQSSLAFWVHSEISPAGTGRVMLRCTEDRFCNPPPPLPSSVAQPLQQNKPGLGLRRNWVRLWPMAFAASKLKSCKYSLSPNLRASLLAQLVKNLPVKQRPRFDPWAGKIPWRREWLPTLAFLPGEFHRLGSLASYGLQPMGLQSQT